MSVFDRLTDKSGYTGMYANRNEQAIDTTNEQVQKHATGHAKNFSEAPIQKFGVQAERPTKFTCWNGLDKHATGQKILLANIRTMDQLVAKCCTSCNVSPQPTFLHTPEGKAIKNLDDIQDSEDYLVIQSGAKYKKESLPTALKTKLGL
eukprot:NODE_9293_length_604_cov_45.889813_g8660_i0.p1 GENE.NODE_9293_length_604_cov_45.889813_g8660_i0~~NODE_9293_length_604_cov_45.889813_g8660_i0.p1  ORF type:complete len:159 (-),score=36.40 NODE_9293_length_604_cov_45.889813_g8660_i0:127-573(-)